MHSKETPSVPWMADSERLFSWRYVTASRAGMARRNMLTCSPPLIQVPTDKFPTVLDIFDVAATPSFLAIKEGHVYFEVRASAGSFLGSAADCRHRPTPWVEHWPLQGYWLE